MDKNKHEVVVENAALFQKWFKERGGIAVWDSAHLGYAGQTWTTPLKAADGGPPAKPDWKAGKVIREITDPSECIVVTMKEVKRFRVGVRAGANFMSLKVTDGGSRRIRAEVAKASEAYGKDASYIFDYSTQEAVINIPEHPVPLNEWSAQPVAAETKEG